MPAHRNKLALLALAVAPLLGWQVSRLSTSEAFTDDTEHFKGFWVDKQSGSTGCPLVFAVVENHVFPLCPAGLVVRNCANAAACREPVKCCDTDLCNGDVNNATDSVPDVVAGSVISTISSVLLLLVSSAITLVFLWGSGEHLTVFFLKLYSSGKMNISANFQSVNIVDDPRCRIAQ